MSQHFAVICANAVLSASQTDSKAVLVKVTDSVEEARNVLVDANSACQSSHCIAVLDFPQIELASNIRDILVAILPLNEAQEAALTRDQFEIYQAIQNQ